jgi:fatty acid desaturase
VSYQLAGSAPSSETALARQGEIYFCHEGNTAERVSRKDISAEKKEAIRKLHVLDQRWNAVIVLHYGIWLAAGWLAVQSHLLIVDLLCYFLDGFSLSTLSVLGHESSHNLLTRNPKIDRWLEFLSGLPILFSAAGYRIVHPLHHKYLHTEQDPDDIENVSKNPTLLRIVYIFVFTFGVYLYLITVPLNAIKKGTRAQRIGVIVEWITMAALAIAAWWLLPARVMLKAWLFPLVVAGQVANLRGIAEHGMTTGGNEFTDTRTVTTHPVVSFMMCNINYHLEHHLYPGVPWYNLPKLHRLLGDDYRRAGSSVYSSYVMFLWDVAKALKGGVVAGSRVIPNHLQEEICL